MLWPQVCILEGKSYSELTAGAETDKELDDCTLLTNSQGKELLAPGRGSQYNAEKKVAIPLNVSPPQIFHSPSIPDAV